MSDQRLHATTVAIGGRGVVILGASGAGKSDLALRLIDRGAVLVSDDQTCFEASAGTVYASPPKTIAGMIEIRGIGIAEMAYASAIPVALAVRISQSIPRMPEPGLFEEITGLLIPLVEIDPREVSATIKVEIALRIARGEKA